MKTTVLLLLLLPFISFGQFWEQLDDFPGNPRDDGTCIKIGNEAYCGSGFDDGFQFTRDFYNYDPGSDEWEDMEWLPNLTNRQYATSFVHDGYGYVFGGLDDNGARSDLWRYDPQSNAWTELFGLPSGGLYASSAFVIGDTAYIVGGRTDAWPATSDVWAYVIPSNGWSQKTSLPTNLWKGIGFEHEENGYVILGMDDNLQLNQTVYKYNPLVDDWQTVPQLTLTPRTYVAHAKKGDKVFLFGGVDSVYLNTFERIDLASMTVDQLTPFPNQARKGSMAFVHNDDFYVTTGVTLNERLTETWVARGILSVYENDFSQSAATVIQSGELLEFILPNEEIQSIEIFNSQGKRVNTGEQMNKVPTTDWTNGIYYYQIEGVNNVYLGKIPVIR